MPQLPQPLYLTILVLSLALVSACDSASSTNESDSFSDDPVSQIDAPFPCEDGQALNYDCNNVDLFAHLNILELSGSQTGVYLNDIWGWTDPVSDKEYALVGLTN